MRTLWTLILFAGILGTSGAVRPDAPATCAPSCDVPSTTAGFVPPVVVVSSGATVTWASTDGFAHTATEIEGFCFHAAVTKASPGRATFRVEDGVLYAKTPDRAEKACASATKLDDGSFLLRYECLYHPSMVGELVIRG